MVRSRILTRSALVLCLALVSLQAGPAQDTAAIRRPEAHALPQRTITSVPFNGTRCFIAIVPIDTSNIDHMPIVGQRRDWPDSWIERNIHILPDSLLRRLPRREGPSK